MEIGDYIRTFNGKIYKILNSDGGDYVTVLNEYNGIYKIDIANIKASHTYIVFLVEEGDYVNGGEVYSNENGYLIVGFPGNDDGQIITNDKIATIATKEQIKNIIYEVK